MLIANQCSACIACVTAAPAAYHVACLFLPLLPLPSRHMQDTLDETLPDTLHMTGIYLMILLTSLAIVTVSIYYYAIMTGALFLAFAMMQYLYLPAATQLKRWAGETARWAGCCTKQGAAQGCRERTMFRSCLVQNAKLHRAQSGR